LNRENKARLARKEEGDALTEEIRDDEDIRWIFQT
jgi:hypothetical protein